MNSRRMDSAGRGYTERIGSEEWLLLVCLLIVGLVLRVQDLGSLSFYADEETTALAVRGILHDGYPHMPSGVGYWRAAPYSYATAGAARLFGLNEFSVRLPSAIFGTLTIPLLYIFARKAFGLFPAVVVTVLLTFSAWHITFSRMGRMYVTFVFFFLLCLLLIYRGVLKESKLYRLAAIALCLFTMTLHELGILLIIIWLIPLAFPDSFPGISKRYLYGVCPALAGAWFAYHRFFNDLSAEVQRITPQQGEPPGFLTHLLETFHFEVTPKFWAVSHVLEHNPHILGAMICIVGGFTLYSWRTWGAQSPVGLGGLCYSLLALILGVFNLFGLVAVGVGLLTVLGAGKARNLLGNRYIQVVILQVLVLFLLWEIYGFFVWKGDGFGELGGLELLRKVVKDSVYFPAMHIMMFFMAFPVMTVTMIVGSLVWLLGRIKGEVARPMEDWVFLSFWVLLLLLGLTREWVALRYLMPVYVLYLLTFGWTLYQGLRWLQESTVPEGIQRHLGRWPPKVGRSLCVAGILVVLPVLNEGHGLEEAIAASTVSYGQRVAAVTHSLLPFRPDHRGAGEYVRSHLQERDVVIAMDVLQQYYYIGKVDYWLREATDAHAFSYERDGSRHDFYTSSRVLSAVRDLESLIDQGRNFKIWLITSGELTGRHLQFAPEGVHEWLSDRHEPVFTGRDGYTHVYLF